MQSKNVFFTFSFFLYNSAHFEKIREEKNKKSFFI